MFSNELADHPCYDCKRWSSLTANMVSHIVPNLSTTPLSCQKVAGVDTLPGRGLEWALRAPSLSPPSLPFLLWFAPPDSMKKLPCAATLRCYHAHYCALLWIFDALLWERRNQYISLLFMGWPNYWEFQLECACGTTVKCSTCKAPRGGSLISKLRAHGTRNSKLESKKMITITRQPWKPLPRHTNAPCYRHTTSDQAASALHCIAMLVHAIVLLAHHLLLGPPTSPCHRDASRILWWWGESGNLRPFLHCW